MTTKNFVVKNGLEAGNITLDAITNIITTTGNVNAANLLTGGQVSATGNVTGNNLNIGNIVSAGGNITGANILTIGNVSASGAVLGSNVYVSSLGSEQIAIAFTSGQLVGGPDLRWEFSNAALWATNIKSNGYISTSGNITGANLFTSGAISTSGNINSNNLTTTGNISANNATVIGILSVSGNLDYTGANAYFSNVSNIKIPGGTANYVLTTDGTGNVSWEPTGRGDANVAGNNTEVQFNDNGNLGASANFTFNKTSNTLTAAFIAGDGSNLTNIAGANVTGTVANATHACTANVVTDGTQSNITAVGTLTSLSSSGNIAGANLLTGGILSANGNITGNYILGNGYYLTGVVTSSTSIQNGNSNVVVEPNSNVTFSITGTSNVLIVTSTGANLTGYANITGNIDAANANLGNSVTANYFIGSGNNLSNLQAANITGTVANANYAAYAGDVVNASQSNITSVGTLSSLSVSGNANVGNLNTTIVSASGNLTAANANLGNSATANYFIGSGNNLSNIQGTNVSGTVANANYAAYAGDVVNATQSNITTIGTLTNLSITGNANISNNINVTGNAVITGNLVVGGNTVYVNVETIRVEDPIIELGGGPNGDPLTSDDGKDRGTLLHYYAGSAIDAFMGWDESNSEFAMGSNVTVTNDVATFNTFGNLRINSLFANVGNFTGNITAANANLGNNASANFFTGNGYYLTSINVANIGTVANANYAAYAGNVVDASQPNITSLGTLSSLSVTGNGNIGNVNTGIVSASGNIIAANANLGNLVSANYFSGNAANLFGIPGANVTGTVANATHASTANTVVDATQSNITSVGTLTSVSVSGNANVGNLNTNGIVSANGNVTGNFILGNGYYLTGIVTGAQDKIANGNSNVYIPAANGNVTITTAGNANVVIITGSGINVAGYANITGNLVAANANLGNAVNANFFIGSGNNLSNILLANISGIGNIASVNLDGNSSNVLYGNGVFSGAASPYGNSNVASFLASYGSNTITTTGNITVGNIIGNGQALTGINGSNVTGTVANANYASYAGNVTVAGQSNITSVGTLTGLSVSGNASFTGANVYISNVANLKIPGGTANYVLTTDGASNLTWSSGAAGSDIVTDAFTGDGSNVAFTLSVTPANENATTVNYNGASVLRSDYSIAGNVLTFDSAPATGSKIEVTTIKTVSFAGLGNISTINLDGNASNILYGNGSFTAPPITTGKSIAMAMIFGF